MTDSPQNSSMQATLARTIARTKAQTTAQTTTQTTAQTTAQTTGQTTANTMTENLLSSLGTTLSPQQRAAILQSVHQFRVNAPDSLAPRTQDVTIMIVDLRGFSDLAASSSPDSLVMLLQPFFARMTELIHEHGGYVDKFLGDGVMALFGAPDSCSDHVQSALRCAAQMQQAMLDMNLYNSERELPPMFAGIGISSGDVMAGTFGSADYCEYTVIGEEVNLAARVQSFALRGEVLLSESCYAAARSLVEVADERRLRVKGRSGPVTLYAMGAVTDPERIDVPGVEVRSSPRVPVDIPLRFHAVENQQVLSPEREGNIVNLGYDGMLAQLELPLPNRGEITFGLATEPTTKEFEDVYARALHQRRTGDMFETAFAFTSVGTRGREAVRRYVDQTLWGP
jgi:adenylate cyclase